MMDEANLRIAIPPKHGANGLVELGSAALVDASGI